MSEDYRPHRVFVCESLKDFEGTKVHEGPSLKAAYGVAVEHLPRNPANPGKRVRFLLGSGVPAVYRVDVTETREATAFMVGIDHDSMTGAARELVETDLRRADADVETGFPQPVEDLTMWLGDSVPVWMEIPGVPNGEEYAKGWRAVVERLIKVETQAAYDAECARREAMGLGPPIPVLEGQGALL